MGSMLKYSDNITPLSCRSYRPIASLCVPSVCACACACSRSTKREREKLEGAGRQSKRRRRNAKPHPVPRTGAFAQIVCAAFNRHIAYPAGGSLLLLLCRAIRLQSVSKERGGAPPTAAYRTRVSIRDRIMVIKVYIASSSGSTSVRVGRMAWLLCMRSELDSSAASRAREATERQLNFY